MKRSVEESCKGLLCFVTLPQPGRVWCGTGSCKFRQSSSKAPQSTHKENRIAGEAVR